MAPFAFRRCVLPAEFALPKNLVGTEAPLSFRIAACQWAIPPVRLLGRGTWFASHHAARPRGSLSCDQTAKPIDREFLTTRLVRVEACFHSRRRMRNMLPRRQAAWRVPARGDRSGRASYWSKNSVPRGQAAWRRSQIMSRASAEKIGGHLFETHIRLIAQARPDAGQLAVDRLH